MYEIVPTETVVVSVVSFQVLNGLTRYISSSHCQAGQGGRIYKLNKLVSKHTNKRKRNLAGGRCLSKKKTKRQRNKSNRKRKNIK
jgi:hypothetical protein